MAKEAVQISVVELMKEAEMDFVDYFSLQKMHTFPACLQGLHDRYAVPMLVAIGPYHHASERLQKMELVKRAAAFHLGKRWGGKPASKEVYEAVLHKAALSRKRYAVDRLPANMADDVVHDFAAMMFFDACFLLHYMEVSVSSKEEAQHDALSKLLFSNRGSIDRDIMLLENQLPWPVVQAIIDCLPEQQAQHYKKDVVGRYIARKGRGFNIRENENEGPPFEWEGSPQHLLDLLRNYKIGKEDSPEEWPNVGHISAPSAIELAQIGIKLKASKTTLFTDMAVREWGPFCCNLSLAPLSLNDTRACCLVNMAAFEVATGTSYRDPADFTAVCSYLALFSMFMLQQEDVDELRAKRILHGHHSNEEMLAFFKSIVKHLPDTGSRFAYIMFLIQDYKRRQRWLRIPVHRFLYNNSRTIIKTVALLGTLLAIFQSLLSLNKIN
jgi:hypothetical protein